MFRVAVRVWLLWGVVTLIANWWFGFNQWVRLWELVEVSRPQVEAFWQGITSIGWRELLVMPFVFIYRRAIFYFLRRARILVFKKGAARLFYTTARKFFVYSAYRKGPRRKAWGTSVVVAIVLISRAVAEWPRCHPGSVGGCHPSPARTRFGPLRVPGPICRIPGFASRPGHRSLPHPHRLDPV